jgi:hypothetical protein
MHINTGDTKQRKEKTHMKLNIKAFALTCGIVWGLGLFLLTWWIIAFDGSSIEPTFIGRLYRGYTISPVGSAIGLVWAFFDGLIGGAIFAWLYNKITGSLESK